MRWAAFLDRDGVLIEYVPLLDKAEQVRLVPGAAQAVSRLSRAGAAVVVVTNQPVIARKLVDEAGLAGIHSRLEGLLAEQGAKLDAIYFCPHHPDFTGPCACRKPSPGMLAEAARRFDIDLGRSFFIGDSTRDLQTARNAGCRCVLVRTGVGGQDKMFAAVPDAVCADLGAAADWVISQAGARR